MALSEIDRNLLDRCLQGKPHAWEDFVDRFIGLITHVIKYTAESSNQTFSSQDYNDFCSEVFLTIIDNDFAVLRNFKGNSSLATYLAVIARRKVVKLIIPHTNEVVVSDLSSFLSENEALKQLYNHDEVESLLKSLPIQEAAVVKLFYLEQSTYKDISSLLNIPENSIGAILFRAKQRLRNMNS